MTTQAQVEAARQALDDLGIELTRTDIKTALDAAESALTVPDAKLLTNDGYAQLPDGTFVEAADGSVWWVEPEFGWSCVTEGDASLSGPARLLVLGRV